MNSLISCFSRSEDGEGHSSNVPDILKTCPDVFISKTIIWTDLDLQFWVIMFDSLCVHVFLWLCGHILVRIKLL